MKIKLRVWDKEQNKFVYSGFGNEEPQKCWFMEDTDGFITCNKLINNDYWQDLGIENISMYTGIKDNEGVEIYANDVVEVLIDGKPTLAVVQFALGSFYLKFKNHKNKLLRDILSDIQVVGNAYEMKKVKENAR